MTAGTNAYGNSIGAVFPARAPSNATLAAALGVAPGSDRTANAQAGIQMLALIITLAISIGGGMFTGLIIKMKLFLPGLDSEKANWCGTYLVPVVVDGRRPYLFEILSSFFFCFLYCI